MIDRHEEPLFMEFDDFETGEMVSECRCDGIMTKQRRRIFTNIPATLDMAVCDRCGEIWYGQIR